MANEAQNDPKTGLAFMNFLLEYRPLQKKLAMHIAHAATAGNWQHYTLKSRFLKAPPIVQETPQLMPSQTWLNQIEQLHNELLAYEKQQDDQENISLQKQRFEQFYQQLQIFHDLTLREKQWHQYYLPAIDKWLKVAKQRLEQLHERQQLFEPIVHNIYRSGEILDPDKDQDIFLGRQDLKSELSHIILTSRSMPMLLICGQRRVGKSSLLHFLPQLLGSQFKIIRQDFQNSKLDSISLWLKDLQQKLEREFKLEAENWQVPDLWITAWTEIEAKLETISEQREEKIILAFDEYENLHKILKKSPEQGERLLEAMRSFSQSQNQVVFLFVGATQFVDLQTPNWDRCFIHALPLKIDYLQPEDAEQLIRLVDLIYPAEVIEKMQTLTQGHPALLQMLCNHIVRRANQLHRKNISLEDVDFVVKQHIIQRGTNALTTFWTEFCQVHQCQPAIHELLNNQAISDRKSQLKLEDYGYIIETETGWKLRVPLLEMWLKRYYEGI